LVQELPKIKETKSKLTSPKLVSLSLENFKESTTLSVALPRKSKKNSPTTTSYSRKETGSWSTVILTETGQREEEFSIIMRRLS
jgi:hypothetical protein